MKRKYKTLKLVWKLLTDKQFRCWFYWTIDYAINNHDEKRGSGASDVVIFIGRGYLGKICEETTEPSDKYCSCSKPLGKPGFECVRCYKEI